jgi:NAD(P)-dependent dehydrogenase (short-subunit alcohol dehydrogenase family)
MTALDGQIVVVVGGSSGIGYACAAEAVRQGARVTIVARRAGALDAAAGALGRNVRTASLDVADGEAVGRLFDAHDTVDHVVVVAGEPVTAPLLTTDIAQQRSVMETRFWGALNVCRSAAPKLTPRGSITLCSGAATARPQPGRPVGVAAGAAVEAFARAAALEFAPVRVNVIAPGPTRTKVFDEHFGDLADERAAALAQTLPARRLGAPADLAGAVVFLMCNPFVTGVTLRVDGGYTVM